MIKTPNSAPTPYATPTDYLARVDVRLTGDLSRDDNTTATPAALLTDPNLAAALADASGEVESACFRGERYTTSDLQSLQGNSLAYLKRIVCGIAVQFLRERRGLLEESEYPLYKWALKQLESLESGAAVLPFLEVEEAGLPSTKVMTAQDYRNLQLFTQMYPRYWGTIAPQSYDGPNFPYPFGPWY